MSEIKLALSPSASFRKACRRFLFIQKKSDHEVSSPRKFARYNTVLLTIFSDSLTAILM
jgi:hypothetical protein